MKVKTVMRNPAPGNDSHTKYMQMAYVSEVYTDDDASKGIETRAS